MATGTFTWQLEAFEEKGKLHLQWSTNAPFRAQQGQISVYKGSSWPSNPQHDRVAWSWDDYDKSPWDTKLTWGSDWYCAYIAEASENGPYKYLIQLVTTGGSDPGSKESK